MEEPLPAGGSCLLGSLVLSGFVENPFTHKAHFNFDKFEEAVCVAVAALNQVLLEGEKLHPLREQRESVYDWKQIGLGTMGLADMFIRLGIKYDSDEAIDLTKTIFKQLATSAVLASLEMAKVEGCFPKCNCQEIAHSEFINALELPSETIKQIEEYGLFNSQLLTCAPTGSIGNLIGTSTGVEPYYQFSYLRNTKSLKNEDTLYEVKEKIVTEYENATGLSYKDNPIFVSSQDIDPFKRLEIQAAMQQYVDAAISSTLNLNENVSVETVANLYKEAWKKGLKGITIFRNNCKRQAILFTSTPKEQKRELDKLVPLKRDEFGTELSGTSYQRKTACGKLYITVNKDKDDNLVELFTNSSKNGTCKANLNAETRLISLCFRLGAKVSEVFDALSHIQCQSCAFARAKGQQIDGISCPDIIAKVIISEYLKTHAQDNNDNDMKECPHCHKKSLRLEGGCCTCVECGWSKCDN